MDLRKLQAMHMEKDNALMPNPRAMQDLMDSKKKKKKPQLSQRDSYNNAMMRAQRNGGSNGVGVGY